MLNEKIKKYLNESVLCWLATVDSNGQPNVSPKETFAYTESGDIIIANIASPNSIKNIKQNPKVALSFINVLVQKGYQIHGEASVLNEDSEKYSAYAEKLLPMLGGRFEIQSIIMIRPTKMRPVLAPSYQFYPETRIEDQVAEAKKAYEM